MSTGVDLRGAELGGDDGQYTGAATVIQHALARPDRSAGTASTSRVLAWLPVPKARPGSSRTTVAERSGGSCQLGTIQSAAAMRIGPNCACERRTQSSSASRATLKSGTAAPPARRRGD
jgi:hypothetical protein